MEQLTHETTFFTSQQFPITVVCDNVYLQQNIGSIFRICEAFGVEKIIFTGANFVFSERKINKTSRNTHKTVPYEIIPNTAQILHFLQTSKAQIIALEITTESKPISEISIKKNEPIILLIGSEIYGISTELLAKTQNAYHIKMFGKNSSINVAQALGIALYEITQKYSKWK
ncbi:TrmH family RNA methyltransferase [Flavobacterium sp.]|uniref:TrmH family RNA methyltransferase n=1 Tax=Flavobacterium sp. TaxID=239 RepID=UPI003529444F